MGNNSNNQGRAYEYAWIKSLSNRIESLQSVIVAENSSLAANKRAWNEISKELREALLISADAAVKTIIELEPQMVDKANGPIVLEFQKDSAGKLGDVRDIIVKKNGIEWEIGLSIKHNHEAVKHSRLSGSIDFGKEWFDSACSKKYWNSVIPIFESLLEKKSKKVKWSDLKNKEKDVYVPLLKAFVREIKEKNKDVKDLPQKMVEYLIGTKDFYKIISKDTRRLTIIRAFNMHGTLNHPTKRKVSAITVPVVQMPTELIEVKFKSNSLNTVEMYLNNGWQLSFRIHNASTIVEPSLKFDVQFVGMPLSVLSIECKWSARREGNYIIQRSEKLRKVAEPKVSYEDDNDN